MTDKVLSMLGLAAKAGKIVSGGFMTEKSIKEGKAKLVILSQDASANTRKHFSDMCAYRNIKIRFYSDKESLGRCIGCSERSNVAITDEGFAGAVDKLLG